MLTNHDLIELTQIRRQLHRQPEVSGEEVQTAAYIKDQLHGMNPSSIVDTLGGHGVAAVFNSGAPGPTVMFRAELDALPIHEISEADWRSQTDGKGHLCGHDGHMTMLLGLGRLLSRYPIEKGRAVLMFQPAEEDGSGARAVVSDPAFAQIKPDLAFAIHNEPGRPFGHVSTRSGLINCASRGLAIYLSGKTAHAARPEAGRSPASAIATLIPALSALGTGGVLDDTFKLATVTHAAMGEPTFGIAPADGVIYVTLRAADDSEMDDMVQSACDTAKAAAKADGLDVRFEHHDVFAASINDANSVAISRAAMDAIEVPYNETNLPMRPSEDFGVFGHDAKAAMLFLGSGEDYAALHNPDYDFPDDLIPIGVSIFERIARDLLGSAPPKS